MEKNSLSVKALVISALFLALGIVLPQALHAIPNAGSVLLPMHIPVLLCGMAAGPLYGAGCGALTVLLSMLFTGMPPVFPVGVSMMAELAVYGGVSGIGYRLLRCRERPRRTYAALGTAMVAGRLVNGALMALLSLASGGSYTFTAFLAGALVTALPGIILQLVLIPPVMRALEKTHLTIG